MTPITILLWVLLLATLAYFIWNYFAFKKMAKHIDNAKFKEMMHYSQIIDLRDPASFRKKHIIGARNFPIQQFDASLNALRKDKPVLVYEAIRGSNAPRAIKKLKKAGFTDLYFLKDGIDYWDGKVKES